MDDDDYCPVTELLRATCAHCTGRNGEPPEPVAGRGGGPLWITAKFGGDCTGCGRLIRRGDQITPDGTGAWLCADCGQ
jgi:hypothetical protein